jgi:hypothetical protein
MVMLTDALNIGAVRVVRACVRSGLGETSIGHVVTWVKLTAEQDEWCEVMSENEKAF